MNTHPYHSSKLKLFHDQLKDTALRSVIQTRLFQVAVNAVARYIHTLKEPESLTENLKLHIHVSRTSRRYKLELAIGHHQLQVPSGSLAIHARSWLATTATSLGTAPPLAPAAHLR
jgi:hypothetical protein